MQTHFESEYEVFRDILKYYCNFTMSTVTASIQELFESGQTFSKKCKLLKGRVGTAGVY